MNYALLSAKIGKEYKGKEKEYIQREEYILESLLKENAELKSKLFEKSGKHQSSPHNELSVISSIMNEQKKHGELLSRLKDLNEEPSDINLSTNSDSATLTVHQSEEDDIEVIIPANGEFTGYQNFLSDTLSDQESFFLKNNSDLVETLHGNKKSATSSSLCSSTYDFCDDFENQPRNTDVQDGEKKLEHLRDQPIIIQSNVRDDKLKFQESPIKFTTPPFKNECRSIEILSSPTTNENNKSYSICHDDENYVPKIVVEEQIVESDINVKEAEVCCVEECSIEMPSPAVKSNLKKEKQKLLENLKMTCENMVKSFEKTLIENQAQSPMDHSRDFITEMDGINPSHRIPKSKESVHQKDKTIVSTASTSLESTKTPTKVQKSNSLNDSSFAGSNNQDLTTSTMMPVILQAKNSSQLNISALALQATCDLDELERESEILAPTSENQRCSSPGSVTDCQGSHEMSSAKSTSRNLKYSIDESLSIGRPDKLSVLCSALNKLRHNMVHERLNEMSMMMENLEEALKEGTLSDIGVKAYQDMFMGYRKNFLSDNQNVIEEQEIINNIAVNYRDMFYKCLSLRKELVAHKQYEEELKSKNELKSNISVVKQYERQIGGLRASIQDLLQEKSIIKRGVEEYILDVEEQNNEDKEKLRLEYERKMREIEDDYIEELRVLQVQNQELANELTISAKNFKLAQKQITEDRSLYKERISELKQQLETTREELEKVKKERENDKSAQSGLENTIKNLESLNTEFSRASQEQSCELAKKTEEICRIDRENKSLLRVYNQMKSKSDSLNIEFTNMNNELQRMIKVSEDLGLKNVALQAEVNSLRSCKVDNEKLEMKIKNLKEEEVNYLRTIEMLSQQIQVQDEET
ncbi:putative protein tag-278 isoform X3 [Copidosoma floridanum]|nr:putative protein tag-278 isoform X3 [Copidosoma floridanum]